MVPTNHSQSHFFYNIPVEQCFYINYGQTCIYIYADFHSFRMSPTQLILHYKIQFSCKNGSYLFSPTKDKKNLFLFSSWLLRDNVRKSCLGAPTGFTSDFYLFVTTIKLLKFMTYNIPSAIAIIINSSSN